MQPPPRNGPPGASSGPPSGGPNMFRRTRPHKHTSAIPPTAQPMTDPFAFVRAPTPMATGGFPTVPNSSPPTMPIPSNNFYSQTGSGQPPQSLQDVPSSSTGSTTPSLPGVALFNPSNAAPPGSFPAQSPSVPLAAYTEQSYFNSREQTPSMASEPSHEASAPAPNQVANSQEYHGTPPLFPLSHQPVPPVSAASQWAPDLGSRPPSVQNYFQPTSDPPNQPMNMQPYSQMFPPLAQSPHHNTHTPPTHSGQPPVQAPLQHPGRSQYIESNAPQQPNMHPPMQNYFSQSTTLSPLDSGYHQMGSVIGEVQPTADSAPLSASNTAPRPVSAPVPHGLSQESGTLSMFFKDDVENEETLTGDAIKAANGISDSFPHLNTHPVGAPLHSGHTGVAFDFHGMPFQPPPQMPYVNDGSAAHGNSQKPTDSLYDHVENFECVPNQEVLPSERHTSPVSTATLSADQFETGPNLETPDSAPRPMRSASVSSNYSNLSHGSGTGSRRHQGVVGTFIQQESPRLTEDFNQSATGGYFEQIDSASAGDMAAHSPTEKNWPPTPSPPKPVGTFQASANSSFEPVRSHSVGVRPVEVDRANMVVEGGADSAPGNLEQPPDNMENIYCLGPPLPTESSGVIPIVTHPVAHSHSRPSSRAYGASRPCESPATTLWAQNDPSSLGTNVMLAPAAPTVLAPLREPSSDVIQPPEDGPLDLHPPQRAQSESNHHSENLENPPRMSEAEPPDPQGSLGYASLLVSDSLHQPILIAPPVSNYNVIPAGTPTPAGSQSGPRESGQLSRTSSQSQPLPPPSNQNPLFASSSNQSPLNLTREKSESASSEITPQSQPICPPLSRSQSLVGESQPSLSANSQASLVTPVSSHNPPTNYELLDFSMHHSQTQNQVPGHSSSLQDTQQFSNGFYLQVTKDGQQGLRAESEASAQTSISSPSRPVAPNNPELNTQPPNHEPTNPAQTAQHRQTNAPSASEADAPSSLGQYSSPTQGPASDSTPPVAYSQGPQTLVTPSPVPTGGSHPPPGPPRPPSTAGSQQGYGPPAAAPPAGAPGHRGYYPPGYGEYSDGRSYLPGQYPPPPPGDTRSQYYPEDPYRNRADWYGRYDGATQAYRDPNYQYREPQPERPSSRTSQYSDRPSSRQGYSDEYRANRGAYPDYYADYSNHYNYAGYNYGAYDPRYRGYYDQSYWSAEGYRGREAYYNQQMYPARKNGYDDQWRYYPGYDPSFDDDYRWRGDTYNDDFDRRSVHSEQSAHSAHSVHSNHSRRSSFSSRSQQSQVYRSQPDLVSAVYDNTASTLAVDYSYGQYPNQTDASQNYSQYQYPSEYTADSTWIAPEQPPPRPATPEKFTMPHRCARFGPGGHMVQVLPNLPSAGQPALVDIYNLETMLQDTSAQAELRAFPGPLIKEDTHKVDVIKFSQNKALECSRDNNLLDRDSARLLWDFIVLLCRQNGTVVGTDIADLLLKEHRSVWLPGKSPNEANLIDFNNEPLSRAEEEPGAGPLSLLSDTFMTVPENVGKETERFRELLLFGRKKDALEAAMKSGLWGHALLLASKMDSRTHARVMTRFANSLPINDPLQTVYQLMSGRMPASATCCGEEKWGDWRPHLAMVLSNLTHTLDLDTRTIATMGDTLASKGLVDAAHFCYLMAQVGLGVYTKKSTKMVLIGSNHSLSFYQFASNEAIQRTEAYEYAQSLGSHSCSLPNFQVYKLIYACRLAEAGLSAQAFHYCEVISKTVLMQPSYYSPIFINQLIQMSEKLRFFDPQLKEKPEQELFREPEWLIHLRQLDGQIKTGMITYNADRSTPAQYDCSSPSSDLDEPSPPEPYSIPRELDGNMTDNPLMNSLLPGPPAQGVQLMPPAPTSILQDNMVQPQLLPPSEVPQLYPVPPTGPQGQMPFPGYPQQHPQHPQDPGYAPPPFQPQPEQVDMYPGPVQPALGPPQVGQVPHHIGAQMPMPPPTLMPPSPAHAPPFEPLQAPPELHPGKPIPSSPHRNSLTPQMDFYDQMANMGPGRRSRTTSQSSMHLISGRRSRTTSESSTHSGGRERSNSAIKQVSPPPPPIPEQPRKEEKKAKRDSPKKSGGRGWLDWLYRKGKNEAHLPDDKNKSIVWDEKKQRWVDLNEPEEEAKPPPPPPSGFPNMPSMPGPAASFSPPSGGPPVNMFSRRAGTKSRYVDVLNPSRTANKPGGLAPAPADIFAPLAPMTMPANLFVPSSAPDDQQPLEGSEGGSQEQSSPNASTIPQMFNPTLVPPAPEMSSVPEGSTSGELSRSSSMSSLSREVSQHLNQGHPPPGAVPTGGVPFYNPAQFAQTSAPSGGGLRSGRLGGQRQYPVMK